MSNWKKFKSFFSKPVNRTKLTISKKPSAFSSVDNIFFRSTSAHPEDIFRRGVESRRYNNSNNDDNNDDDVYDDNNNNNNNIEFRGDVNNLNIDMCFNLNNKDFKNYTINEIKSTMINIINNDVDVDNLKINQIKQIIKNDFRDEYLIGSMTIKKIRDKLYKIRRVSNSDDLELIEIVCILEADEAPEIDEFDGDKMLPIRRQMYLPGITDDNKSNQLDNKKNLTNVSETTIDIECKTVPTKVDDINASYDKDICKICIENEIDCVFIECGHLMSCLKCSEELTFCPFCRQEIVKIMKIYRV